MIKLLITRYGWLILILVILLILTLPFFLATKGGHVQSPQQNSSVSIPGFFHFSNPTPTPFTQSPLSVVQTNPSNQQTDISTSPTITVDFSRSLNSSEQNVFKFNISPLASGSASWNSTHDEFTFTPSLLLPTTTYTLSVVTMDFSYAWSFTTTDLQPTNTPQIQQGLDAQTKSDENWGKKIQDVYQKYPWYDQLPISSDDYFVSFDSTSHILTADLFLSDPTSISQINAVKGEVQQNLASLGIDISKIAPHYVIHAKNLSPTPGS